MGKLPIKRTKHIPVRTCVACRETLPKRSLIRVVKTSEGVKVDLSGKIAGRGAYLHDQRSCWEKGLSGPLARSLKTELKPEDRELLSEFMDTLKENCSETLSKKEEAKG